MCHGLMTHPLSFCVVMFYVIRAKAVEFFTLRSSLHLEIDVETNSKHIVVTSIVRVVVEALLGRELNIL